MRQLKISQSITHRDDISTEKYLQDIGKEDLISAEEEVELAQRIKLGDQQALEKLVKANLRFVVSVAKQYQNQGLPLPDLISEGNLGLIKAAKRFDETRGFKFITYAVWRIRQSILEALLEYKSIVRIPLNKAGIKNNVKNAISELEQQLEREPSTLEVAEYLDIPEIQVVDAIIHSLQYMSVDAPMSDNSDATTFVDMMPSTSIHSPDHHIAHTESLKKEIFRVFATLQPKEADVLRMYFGIGEKQSYTLEEIGERFDLTRERVRQIKEKGIKKMRKISRSELLRNFLGK